MKLKHAIKTLEKELDFLNTPLAEDLIGGVLHFRQTHDIKLALKILNQFIENSKALN
jgi:hypothetical protein